MGSDVYISDAIFGMQIFWVSRELAVHLHTWYPSKIHILFFDFHWFKHRAVDLNFGAQCLNAIKYMNCLSISSEP